MSKLRNSGKGDSNAGSLSIESLAFCRGATPFHNNVNVESVIWSVGWHD